MSGIQQQQEHHVHKNKKIMFDIVIPMPNEAIYACYYCQGHELGAIMMETRTGMSIQHTHMLLEHFL